MNIIITTLNSKYIHSALAIRYLESYTMDLASIELLEFTVNQNIDFIAGEIYKKNPDIVAFSTYIWNRNETLKICNILKMVKPEIRIILGGPEVSFDGVDILRDYPSIDFIVYGEGEKTFRELIKALLDRKDDYSKIDGIIFREDGKIIQNPTRPLIDNLDSIPSPYMNVDGSLRNKIVYYESSRGCPFNCQFCLSSTIKGVRYFSLDRVKEDLEKLIRAQVKQVKFVDRTFNANKKFAMEIMDFIMKKDPRDINFHFEVTAHLLDRDMLEFIKKAREGLFQFEIGVQSTNPKTIEAVGRITDFEKLSRICKEIKRNNNIHQHLDLIAGLPYEGYESFKKSFNDVYNIKPEKIQLGFLKLLKGSGLRRDKDKYNYKFLDEPPYEVLESKYITYKEMLKLKGIEDLVEKYYNEGYFINSLEYLIENNYKTAFDFFEDFLYYWEGRRYHSLSHSRNNLYKILLEFYKDKKYDNLVIFNELIKYDYLVNNSPNIPDFINRDQIQITQGEKHRVLKDERLLNGYLIRYRGKPTKEIVKRIHIERFEIDILKFIEKDYKYSDYMDRETYILFDYHEGHLIRCKTYDITRYVEREG
ncbi:B12-binding domain-containing radical SAM protein [Tepidimicrobium xylanilyticum]